MRKKRTAYYIDLTGKTFGKWMVIKRNGKSEKGGEPLWLCKCSCEKGTIKNVRGSGLREGTSLNCGCERILKLIETTKTLKKFNRYEEYDSETMIGYSRSPSNDIFYFDKSDYEKIKNNCWKTNNYGYITTSVKRKTYTIQALFFNFPKEIIDHIDRNKMNNKRNNLRLVSRKENSHNRSIDSDNNSGFMGVSKTSKPIKGKIWWRARITINDNGKVISKSFPKKKDAIIQRLSWELQYYGSEFSPQRHLFEKYGIK